MMKRQSKYALKKVYLKQNICFDNNTFKYVIKYIFSKCLGFKDAKGILQGVHISLKWTKSLVTEFLPRVLEAFNYHAFSKELAITFLYARWCPEDQKRYQIDEYI